MSRHPLQFFPTFPLRLRAAGAGPRVFLLALAVAACGLGACSEKPPSLKEQQAMGVPLAYAPLWSDVRSGEHAVALDVDRKGDDIIVPVWNECFDQKKGIMHGHVVPDDATGKMAIFGQTVGQPLARPAAVSARFQKQIDQAAALYAKQEFSGSAAALEEPFQKDHDNPFLIEEYARALYRTQRRSAAAVHYRRLVTSLDAVGTSIRPDYVYLDHWFLDAYWKLATLDMDEGHWQAAICGINRVLLTAQPETLVHEAFDYLVEAEAASGRHDLARLYADETLRRFPGDTYVGKFVSPPQAAAAAGK
jgi:tetratricopeptide (TPR) repeat protein